jgi:hypothetical protein
VLYRIFVAATNKFFSGLKLKVYFSLIKTTVIVRPSLGSSFPQIQADRSSLTLWLCLLKDKASKVFIASIIGI